MPKVPVNPELDTSAKRMAQARVRRKQKGLIQITIWVNEEQREFLNRIAVDLNGTLSEAAQLLIFKNVRQLQALGVLK